MIPAPAAEILSLIRLTETGRADRTAYDTVYGHSENKLTQPITTMTVDELQGHQSGFTKAFGSSASGGYQIMKATLSDLRTRLALTGTEVFDPPFQDELGYELLRRRGYEPWVTGRTSTDTLMIGLSKEWASFPVPSRMRGAHRTVERGQSYYAGDGVNKALVGPDVVWLACEAARTATVHVPPEPVPPKPEEPGKPGDDIVLTPEEWRHALDTIGKVLSNPVLRDAILEAVSGEGA
jgi:muramidase (phage lysozyme)